jgi:hypothetical protein
MTIAACATSPATPPPAVDIPADCDRLKEPAPYPALVKREDLGVRAGKYAAALKEANGRIVKGRQCDAEVRATFAGRR